MDLWDVHLPHAETERQFATANQETLAYLVAYHPPKLRAWLDSVLPVNSGVHILAKGNRLDSNNIRRQW